MQAYYIKCRAKKEMKDPKATTMKNGKLAMRYFAMLHRLTNCMFNHN